MNHPMIGKNCRSSGGGSGNPWRGYGPIVMNTIRPWRKT